MIILHSAVTRPMQRALRGLLIIAVVIFLSWIATSWINYEVLRTTPKPETAKAFVHWWLSKALDYSPDAAKQHEEAEGWMSPDSMESFKHFFWSSPRMKNFRFEVTDLAASVVKDKTIRVVASGRRKQRPDYLTYRRMKLGFGVIKVPNGYRISNWEIELFELPEYCPPAAGREL